MGESMFADCILENAWADRSLTNPSRRGWTTLSSFGLQAVVIGLLLLLPILRNVALPAARTVSTPVTLGHVREPGTTTHLRRGGTVIPVTNLDPNRLMLPSHNHHVAPNSEQAGIEVPDGFIGNGTGFPMGGGDGLPISIFSGTRPVMPAAPPKPVRTFRTSNMLEGSLIRRVQPTYPPLARTAHVQGSVVLLATISTAGMIENLRELSGHPLLAAAAIDAVKQWRYRPYILNGEPIELETEITVNFVLGN
jgi:periplasmic protein TonB